MEQDAVRSMLEARTVAVVGASERAGSFGWRMTTEVARSPGPVEMYPVNPRYDRVLGRACVPSLDDLPEPVDLVLLGVRDEALEAELGRARARATGPPSSSAAPTTSACRRDPRCANGSRPSPGEPGWPCAAAAAWASSISSTGSGRSATSSPIHCPAARRVRQPLRLRILGAAQDPPAARLHARGLLGPGARHAGRLVSRLRARPPRDWHRGAAPRGPPGARGVAVGARPSGRAAGSRSLRSRSAVRRPAAPWWPPIPAPSPATTGPGRHCSTHTGSSESGISTR